mgnify:CR=1 FL=1
MSISYNSLTGIEGNPITYISELATRGREKLDSSSATTRIVILLAIFGGNGKVDRHLHCAFTFEQNRKTISA